MPTKYTPPELSYQQEHLLSMAGPHRAHVAASLWPGLTGAVAEITAQPKNLRRLPAKWVPHVVPLLDPAVATEAMAADGRVVTHDAVRRLLRVPAAPTPAPAPESSLPSLGDLAAAVAAGEELKGEHYDALATYTYRTNLVDDLDLLHEVAVAMWRAARTTGATEMLTPVVESAKSSVLAKVLVAERTWDLPEYAAFYRLAEQRHEFGEGIWAVIAAGPPVLSVVVPDDERVALLTQWLGDRGLSRSGRLWVDSLLNAAAGELGGQPDLAMLSRVLWGEHTASVMVWMAEHSPAGPELATETHRRYVLDSRSTGSSVEAVSQTDAMCWALERLVAYPALRASLAVHCRRDESLAMWAQMASPAEVDDWYELACAHAPVTAEALAALAATGTPVASFATQKLVDMPGVPYQAWTNPSTTMTPLVLHLLHERLGDTPARWATAVGLLDTDVALDELCRAVVALTPDDD